MSKPPVSTAALKSSTKSAANRRKPLIPYGRLMMTIRHRLGRNTAQSHPAPPSGVLFELRTPDFALWI
jgi:hypothetical protein